MSGFAFVVVPGIGVLGEAPLLLATEHTPVDWMNKNSPPQARQILAAMQRMLKN